MPSNPAWPTTGQPSLPPTPSVVPAQQTYNNQHPVYPNSPTKTKPTFPVSPNKTQLAPQTQPAFAASHDSRLLQPTYYSQESGLVAQYTDHQFLQSQRPPAHSPRLRYSAPHSRISVQRQSSYPAHNYEGYQSSHPSESIYAGESLTTYSPSSSGWTSESSLLSSASPWNSSGPQMPPPPRFPNPQYPSNQPANSQHLYARLQPQRLPPPPLQYQISDPGNISLRIRPTLQEGTGRPIIPPPRDQLPHSSVPPSQQIAVAARRIAENAKQVKHDLPSSHQITVVPSILNEPNRACIDPKLTVLPLDETYARLHYSSDDQQLHEQEQQCHSIGSDPSLLSMNQQGDPRRPGSGVKPSATGNHGQGHGSQGAGTTYPLYGTEQFHSLPHQSYQTPHNSMATHTSQIPTPFMPVADNLHKLSVSSAASLSNLSSSMSPSSSLGSYGSNHAAGSTIYSAPGHPIIYPSQNLPQTAIPSGRGSEYHMPAAPQYKSNIPVNVNRAHQHYDPLRKSSLPVIKSGNIKGNKPQDRKNTVAGKPLPVMDRKQAVYTIRNSLPANSRSSPPIAPNRKKHPENLTVIIPSAVKDSNDGASIPVAPPRTKHEKSPNLLESRKSSLRHGVYEPLLNPAVASVDSLDNVRLESDPEGHIYEVLQPLTVDNTQLSNDNINCNIHSSKKTVERTMEPTNSDSTNKVPLHIDLSNSNEVLGLYGTNDSVQPMKDRPTQEAIDRIKRNVDKKEEFLRRPSDPIWPPTSVHKDYHVYPQKLNQPLWPPPSTQVPPSPGVISKALTFVANSKMAAAKRKKAKAELEARTIAASRRSDHAEDDHGGFLTSSTSSVTTVIDPKTGQPSSARPLVVNAVPKPFTTGNEAAPGSKYGKSFVTNLPRIQENLPSKELGSLSSLGSLRSGSATSSAGGTPSGSQLSLHSPSIRSIPMAWVGDNDRIKQLQIVSKRAKKFEGAQHGRSGKTALQRFELSRLSQRSKIAERKQEFERLDSQRTNSIAGVLEDSQRGSSVDGSSNSVGGIMSGNRTTVVGGPQVHCPPPLPGTGARTPLGQGEEGERLVRRVSYLKATSADRPYSDEDVDSEPDDRQHSTASTPAGSDAGGAITPATPSSHLRSHHHQPPTIVGIPSPATTQHSLGAAAHGALHYKLSVVDGKRAVDRSWKSGCGVLRGRVLLLYKDKSLPMQSPVDVAELQVCVRGATVSVASDYSKRRHVVRLTTPGGTQLLLQADSQTAMSAWLQTLHQHAAVTAPLAMQDEDGGLDDNLSSSPPEGTSNGSSKASLLTDTSTTTTTTTITTPTTTTSTSYSTGSSPPSTKNARKLGALRTHSPTGQSPQTKARKSTGGSAAFADIGGEKSKTWKGLIGKRLKKIQGSTPTSTSASYTPGASFGVPLPLCPMSEKHGDMVPLVVGLCVEAVEERGMNTQGIYRIPGNKAAVTYLTEMVNRGPQSIDLTDHRWSDVNVISSLLKQYFQKLPEPLIPSDLYPHLLQASQTSDPLTRLTDLRVLVHELPEYHYETLRFLCLHLQRVVVSSDSNRMDVHNLAIMFGPTLIRAAHDNMAKMVKDMPHQCRIVEALISQATWFFSDEECDDIGGPSLPDVPLATLTDLTPITDTDPLSTQALLDNVHKLQGSTNGHKSDSKKVLVSSIISAASRKVNKSRHRRSGEEIECDWSSRDIERSRDGGERLRDNAGDNRLLRENERLTGDSERLRIDNESFSQQSSHSDIAMSLDATPKSSRSVSKTSCYSADSVNNSQHNSLQDGGYSSVKLRKDNTRCSLDNEHFGNTGSDFSHDRSVYDNSSRTSMPVNTSVVDSSSLLSSCLGSSTPNIMNTTAGEQQVRAASCRPVSTYEGSSLSSSGTAGQADGIAIKSYKHLSSNTKLRVRLFEQETRAMLDKDPNKQRRQSTRLEFDKQSIDDAIEQAKRELEEVDVLDLLADNPSQVVPRMGQGGSYLHNTPLATSDNNNSLSPASAPYTTNVCTLQDDPLNPGDDLDYRTSPCGEDLNLEHHDDGSDMLNAITATFEKMRSEVTGGEVGGSISGGSRNSSTPPTVSTFISSGDVYGSCDPMGSGSWADASSAAEYEPPSSGRGHCKLYRDPSLHRRTPTAAAAAAVDTSSSENNNMTGLSFSETSPNPRKKSSNASSKSSASVKRTDSLTKSEKTENNLKEKSEKRCRELKRPEIHEDVEEKKPKEMRHSTPPETSYLRQLNNDLNKGDVTAKSRRLSTDVRHRRHNVKELKEKFEPSLSMDNNVNNNVNANNASNANNNRRNGNRRSRSNIKRRHTVGGTKDLGKVMALQKALLQWQQLHGEQSKAILQQQHLKQSNITPEALHQLISFEPWEARERLGASSPDLPHLLDLLMSGQEQQQQQQHRRLSVREPWVLQPVLESHV